MNWWEKRDIDTALADLQRRFVNTEGGTERKAALHWAAEKVGQLRAGLAARTQPAERAGETGGSR